MGCCSDPGHRDNRLSGILPSETHGKKYTDDIEELKRIIREKDRLFAAMADAFDGLIFIISIDYRVLYMNKRMLRYTGHDAAGQFCYQLFHNRSSVCPWCAHHRVLEGETVRYETIWPKDGRWYYVINTPIHHTDGSVSKYAIMMDIHDLKQVEEELKNHRDRLEDMVTTRTAALTAINAKLRKEIEERKQIERSLRENQQRYRILFEGSMDAIFIIDQQARIYDVNEAAVELTGYARHELIGRAIKDLYQSFDQEAFNEYFNRVMRGDSYFNEAEILREDGRLVTTEFSSKMIVINNRPLIHTSIRDISARKAAEEALQQSEAKYRELVENANSIIIRFDTEGRITFFNEYAQRFFGWSEEEIIGKKLLDTILPSTDSKGRDMASKLHNFFESPDKYEANEIENRCRDGRRVWVAWTNRPINTHDGRIKEFLCVGVDITERKQAKEHIQSLTHQLLKAQENERLKISRDLHDHIAQDLSSLNIGLQTLFDGHEEIDPELNEKVAYMINILQRSITEVRNLAYDLRPPGLDQLGLVRTLYIYCEEFEKTSGIRTDFSAAGLNNLKLDDDVQINIYRLIQEALHNAKKHARADRVVIRLVVSSPHLLVRIIDDGQGFDVARWKTHSLSEKHMGLQSMVERTELLGGSIDIRSRPASGTGIFIKIPIKEIENEQLKDNSSDNRRPPAVS